MSYSALTTPPKPAGSAEYDPLAGDDPLLEAWSALRQLRTTPFEAAESHHWRNAVRALARSASEAVSRHIMMAERETSTPRRILSSGRSRSNIAYAQLAEHRHLLAEAHAFERRCRSIPEVVEDIWVVVDVTESAIVLEMMVARHRNRLVELINDGAFTCSDDGWHQRGRLEGGEPVAMR